MKLEISEKLGRRRFLRCAIGTATLSALPLSRARDAQNGSSDGKTRRLACNSWPFRGYFDTPEMREYRNSQLPSLAQADFPEFLADHFGIHNVEFLPQHFADTQSAAIERVNAGLKKAHSHCCNLMGVEIPGGVFSPAGSRKVASDAAERWVGVATALGAPSITVALTGKGSASAAVAAENLMPFADIAHRHGIKVLFHNDSLQFESAEILTSVIQKIGPDKAGACPDFGNFATKSAGFALKQLQMLAPFASNICHAKDGIADDGKFYADDFAASMKVMRDAGFNGLYSLEFEGLGDPIEGVRKLMKLTLEYLD